MAQCAASPATPLESILERCGDVSDQDVGPIFGHLASMIEIGFDRPDPLLLADAMSAALDAQRYQA